MPNAHAKHGTTACITRAMSPGVMKTVTSGSWAVPTMLSKVTHPAVVECAITGVPDEIRGQVVKATIVLAKDYKDKAGDALVKELQDHVKKVTAPYKYPRVVEFVDELPKTISGKIRRVEIRATDNEKKHTK